MKTAPFSTWAWGKCFYCDRETYSTGPGPCKPHTYTRDHLIPKKLRRVSLKEITGKLAHSLTVTCCHECNQKKGMQSAYRFAATMNLPLEKMKVIHRAYSLNRRDNADL
jgi:hypothetical protein